MNAEIHTKNENMTIQEQIRQEQEAQLAAPHKPQQRVVQAISHLLHPLFMLTVAALVICRYTPFMLFSYRLKAFFVGEVAFFTFLMPVLIITLLHVFHVIGHWALRDVRDRTIPFLTNFVCYLTNYMVLRNQEFIPYWVLVPYFGSVILTFVAWIVSFWWKISAHTSAASAMMTFVVLQYLTLPEVMPLWLVFASVIMVGGLCSIRVYLGRHTMAQVGAGVALGIVSILIGKMVCVG